MLKNHKHPKISIVTPSLNQGQYLEATILSVISQNYPNLEYIIVDGGSSDNSLKIISQYSKYLHFWCSEPDNGHYAAVNKGFERATGDIFAWLNSDDMFRPDALRTVGSIFSTYQEVAWLTTLQQLVWDRHGEQKSIKKMPGYSREAFLDGHYMTRKLSGLGFIQQESTFWRRGLWEKVGGIRTSFNLAGDFDLWARFFLHEDLHGVDQPLGGFRVHDENRSLQSDRYLYEAENALEEMRQRLNWSFTKKQFFFQGIIMRRPVLRRIVEFIGMRPNKKYIGPIVSQANSSQGKKWRMMTTSF